MPCEWSDESIESKGRIKGLKKSNIAERLEQARHGALCQYSWAESFIPIRRDEDDRNVLPTKLQFPLKFRSGHARHADVEDQTRRFTSSPHEYVSL